MPEKPPPIDRRATVFQRLIQGAVSARIAPENLRHHLEQLSVKEREDLAIATGGQRGDGKAIEILIQYLRTDPY